jgi:hypothetical protein
MRGLLVATFLLVELVGACQPAASMSPNEGSPPGVLQSPVAGSLPRKVETAAGSLLPLLADQLPLVRITSADALGAVLAREQQTGWPDLDIAFKSGGCVLVAWYVRHPMSMAPSPPAPSPVYVVRLVGEGDPSQETWVMVDATTGEEGAAFGGPSISDCA